MMGALVTPGKVLKRLEPIYFLLMSSSLKTIIDKVTLHIIKLLLILSSLSFYSLKTLLGGFYTVA